MASRHSTAETREGEAHWPLIVDIKRHSLEDGPGIRSVVFFKGCGLRCSFCQNPEAIRPQVEIAAAASRCIECGLCVDACPRDAVDLSLPGLLRRSACDRCAACAEACPTGALRRIGRRYSPEDLARILLRDLHYYRASGGGVTLSGGEPALFPEYGGEVLRILKEHDVHVVLETGGHFDHYERLQEQMLPYVDLVYFSVKIADPEAHRLHTGHGNELVFANLRRLLREPTLRVEPRIPLIPEVTDSRENLRALVEILRDAGADSAVLLPYNPLGVHMAESLGRQPPLHSTSFMKPEEIERIHHMFADIVASSSEPFTIHPGGPQRTTP